MQILVPSKSKTLLGVSDLTLVATIKRGLIPALDSRTYETRVRLLLRTLNALRVSSQEAEPTPLIPSLRRIRGLGPLGAGRDRVLLQRQFADRERPALSSEQGSE